MTAKRKTKFFVGSRQRAGRLRKNIDDQIAMYDNRMNIPDQLNVTSVFPPSSTSVEDVEDGENTLPIETVDFKGSGREHFDDLSVTSHSSDESVLCNVSTVDNDSNLGSRSR
jgi:hypothetical protein